MRIAPYHHPKGRVIVIQPLKMVPWETNNMVLSRNRSPNNFDNLINLNAEKFDEQSKIFLGCHSSQVNFFHCLQTLGDIGDGQAFHGDTRGVVPDQHFLNMKQVNPEKRS